MPDLSAYLPNTTAVAESPNTKDWRYSTEEALKHFGLDWTVSLQPLYLENGTQWEGSKALLRDDNSTQLAIVGDRYVPIQNARAFQSFEPFVHERDCEITEVGSFNGGRILYLQARIKDQPDLEIGVDQVKPYILMATSHNQSIGFQIRFVETRVICQNTLRSALAENTNFQSVRHTQKYEERLQKLEASIDIFRRNFETTATQYRTMAKRDMTVQQFRTYLETLFTKDLTAASKRLERTATLENLRTTSRLLAIREETPDLQVDGVRGTAWSGFNAVTQWLSHERSNSEENRQRSLLLGDNANLLDRARELALV